MNFAWKSIAGCLALAVVAMLGMGCSFSRDPAITVMGAKPDGASDEAMRLDITLDLVNPNKESLRLANFDYDVTVNGVKAFSAVRAAEATLASNDHRQLTIPVVVRYDTMGWTPQTVPPSVQYSVRGSLSYLPPDKVASIFLDIGLPKPSASFAGEGETAVK